MPIAALKFQQDPDRKRMGPRKHLDRCITWIQPDEGITRIRIEMLKQDS
jgi:hypothetical protein